MATYTPEQLLALTPEEVKKLTPAQAQERDYVIAIKKIDDAAASSPVYSLPKR